MGLEPFEVLPENIKISPEIFMYDLLQFIKILPQKRGIEKSLWVKKFIKKVEYSKEEITIKVFYRENPGKEITANDANGWVGAATGKDNSYDFNKEIPNSICRNKSSECIGWLAIANEVRTRIISSDKIIFIPGLSF